MFFSCFFEILVITKKRLALTIESSNEQNTQNTKVTMIQKITEVCLFSFFTIYDTTNMSIAILEPDTAKRWLSPLFSKFSLISSSKNLSSEYNILVNKLYSLLGITLSKLFDILSLKFNIIFTNIFAVLTSHNFTS